MDSFYKYSLTVTVPIASVPYTYAASSQHCILRTSDASGFKKKKKENRQQSINLVLLPDHCFLPSPSGIVGKWLLEQPLKNVSARRREIVLSDNNTVHIFVYLF